MKINVYDFDKTVYNGDSSLDFYLFCLKNNKKIFWCIPKQVFSFVLYKIGFYEKIVFKELFFSFLNKISDIDEYVMIFWKLNNKKINKWFNNKDAVIISASPKFLLEPICSQLGVKKLIATEVDRKSGKFYSKNCYGEEKVIRLKEEYTDFEIETFYSDSDSDLPLKILAKKSYKVRHGKIENWK